jgi:hypothetical protein
VIAETLVMLVAAVVVTVGFVEAAMAVKETSSA